MNVETEPGAPGPASTRRGNVPLLVLLAVFLTITVASSPGITVTLDEPLHYHYGRFVLEGKTDRIDDSSMPAYALNALPAHLAQNLAPGVLRTILERYFLARLVTILMAAAFAVVVYRWTRSLYGMVPATFSTALYVLDPNIIAHSQLVTTDVLMAGMLLSSFFFLWKFANGGRSRDGIACCVFVGLSQLVKYTAVALLPLGLLALLAHDLPSIREAFRLRGLRGFTRYIGRLALLLGAILMASALFINIGFLFNRSFARLREYQFRSELFRTLQTSLRSLGEVPIPVPYPYLQGLDWMRDTERTADRYGNIYLLGHLSKPAGFPGYYLIAAALKMPIASQVLIGAALGVFAVDARRRRTFLRNEVFLLLPAALLVTYFNFFFNAQTGIRYYLVVFPLLYVFAGSLFTGWQRSPRWAKAAAASLLGYLAISVLSYFPYFTPYFNEFVWDKTQTYKFLSDTNLEWGQSRDELKRYLAENPKAVVNPTGVQAGTLVVGGSDLVGILEDPSRYAWLRDNFEPVETIAYCYFVFRVSEEEAAKLCAGSNLCD